jgi:hypothetical protein
LGRHASAIARCHGLELNLTTPAFERLATGRSVHKRLEHALMIDPEFNVLLVHRDAEGQGSEHRLREIADAVTRVAGERVCIPIIPVRMTEAWLILDEDAIRKVAGRPSGRDPLDLPAPNRAEAVADPKAVLREALRRASGFGGRRLRKLDRDFNAHRRILLETLDRTGPVRQLASWRAFEDAVERAARELLKSSPPAD